MLIPEREKTTDRYSVSGVIAITKCPIPARAVNRFTVRRDVLRQCGRTGEDCLNGERNAQDQ